MTQMTLLSAPTPYSLAVVRGSCNFLPIWLVPRDVLTRLRQRWAFRRYWILGNLVNEPWKWLSIPLRSKSVVTGINSEVTRRSFWKDKIRFGETYKLSSFSEVVPLCAPGGRSTMGLQCFFGKEDKGLCDVIYMDILFQMLSARVRELGETVSVDLRSQMFCPLRIWNPCPLFRIASVRIGTWILRDLIGPAPIP